MNDFSPDIIQPNDIVVLEDYMAHQHDDSVILDENTIILAAGNAYDILDMDAIWAAYKKYGKSYQHMSKRTGVSKEAIYKFLKGRSKSPSFYNVIVICKELGVSVDEVCRIRKSEPDATEQKLDDISKTVKDMQKTIELLQKTITTLTADLNRNYLSDSNNY